MIQSPSRLNSLQPDGPGWPRVACEGSEHADGEELTPGMRRKSSIELAGKRATLAETGAWTELWRMYVRDLLSFKVDAGGDGTHTLQQSTTLKADTMRASDKKDSCNIWAALQILQTSVRVRSWPPSIASLSGVGPLPCLHVPTHSRNAAGPPSECPVAALSAFRQPLGPGSAASTTPLAIRLISFAGGGRKFRCGLLHWERGENYIINSVSGPILSCNS